MSSDNVQGTVNIKVTRKVFLKTGTKEAVKMCC